MIIIIILFVIECLAVEILWYLAEFNLTRSKGVFDFSNSDAQNILAPDIPDVSEIDISTYMIVHHKYRRTDIERYMHI